MLQQELPLLESGPVGSASKWFVPAIAVASAATGAGLLWIVAGDLAAILFAGASAVAFAALAFSRRAPHPQAPRVFEVTSAPDL
jgi:hypothetical protein